MRLVCEVVLPRPLGVCALGAARDGLPPRVVVPPALSGHACWVPLACYGLLPPSVVPSLFPVPLLPFFFALFSCFPLFAGSRCRGHSAGGC
eukprot:8984651-Alexandrium_andersonii.AAC.1